jgi:hypothetical protein
MKCPHCDIGINLDVTRTGVYANDDGTGKGLSISSGHCPECEKLIVILRHGTHETGSHGYEYLEDVTEEEVIYPNRVSRRMEPEVPDPYRKDFLEACGVLPISPKASAALSRRILQNLLREEFKIKHSSLAREIEDFIQGKDVPSYLATAIDAIRNVGNFAAHPLKDTNTGEIVEVESGEAEWLLEVNESLFDFAFVQPKRLEERKKNLNAKLAAMGKPEMKTK